MEKSLAEMRREIDEINAEMKSLFLRRMSLSKKIGEYKKANNLPILDENREKEIIEKNTSELSEPLKGYTERFFKKVMSLSREYQNNSFAFEPNKVSDKDFNRMIENFVKSYDNGDKDTRSEIEKKLSEDIGL